MDKIMRKITKIFLEIIKIKNKKHMGLK